MAQYESNVKHVPYSQEQVYNKLSDLNHLSSIRERLDLLKEKLDGKLEDMSFDSDSLTLKVQGISLTLRIIEREEPKTIKFESANSPMPFNFWIQLLPVNETESKMRLTIKADIPFMLKGMVTKPLQEGIEKIAEALAMIPYGE